MRPKSFLQYGSNINHINPQTFRTTPQPSNRREVLHRTVKDMLEITCWCEREIVYVTAQDVWDGRTKSCGHPTCKEPDGPSKQRHD